MLHTESYTFDRTRSYIVRDKRNSSWGKIDSCNGSATRGKVRNHRHGKIDNIGTHALRLKGDIGLHACQKGIKMLHLQGQCRTNETEQRLMSDFNADIFKTDKQATNAVFASLQDTVKFV